MTEQGKAPAARTACATKLARPRQFKRAAVRRVHAVNEAEVWNSVHVVGSPVCVHRDNGEVLPTRTRSEADVIGDTAVVWVDGISGAYALFRIHDRNGERSEPAEGRPSPEIPAIPDSKG